MKRAMLYFLHFNAGSILLGFGVFDVIFESLNTCFRIEKLFPRPHLFAGVGNVHISYQSEKIIHKKEN